MKYLIIIFTFFLFIACSSSTKNCTYEIALKQIIEKGSDTLQINNAVGYAFYADTSDFTPASYDQALSGKMTSRTSSETISAQFDGTFDATTGTMLIKDVTGDQIVVVVCDTDSKIYGYKEYTVGTGIPIIYGRATFRTWQFAESPDTTLNINGWFQKKVDRN